MENHSESDHLEVAPVRCLLTEDGEPDPSSPVTLALNFSSTNIGVITVLESLHGLRSWVRDNLNTQGVYSLLVDMKYKFGCISE